jgi:enoyl-CoA hydratase/carnithine racemase
MSQIVLEKPAPGVALVRLNRPEALNALDMAIREELAACVTDLAEDAEVRAVVITGDERAFAAGADLAELRNRSVLDRQFAVSRKAWAALEQCPKPLIAAVAGYAFGGGCELALHCDIVLAAESAQFALREVRLGIMPGAGGTQRLLRVAGHFKAARYLLTGDTMDARIASDIGLVSEVFPDEALLPEAIAMAGRIAALPALSIQWIKEAIHLGADAPLQTALAMERKSFQLLFASEDREEGIGAFLDKRQPRFKGR